MTNHTKKKIAPIVITVISVIYYIAYFAVIMAVLPILWKILLGVIPLCLAGVMIYVCIQRIKEIDKGEEDDISKY